MTRASVARPIRALLLPVLLLVTPGRTPAEPPASGLDSTEIAALREALHDVDPVALSAGPIEPVIATLEASPSSGLTAGQVANVAEVFRRDASLLTSALEVLEDCWGSERVRTSAFNVCWKPDERGTDQLHEQVELEALARLAVVRASVEARFGIADLGPIPLRIVPLRGPGRTWPRSDLRWGIQSSAPVPAQLVAEVALLELGNAPFLVDALAVLHGTCHGDAECRRQALGRALAVLGATRPVPILEGLQAGTLTGEEDPAFATGLLFIARLERIHPPQVLAALLRATRLGTSPPELRLAVSALTRESPAAVDRALAREVDAAGR